ncbi:hypothetical protein FDP41_007615 [Naegleria fowleri]|uniref:Thioredoxin domain-containing protein n=1 Tax=Naegleria fowleri TaxID=5763 RepID=A0A6A5CDP0_NAEFO|nr:uncharacterized protein FDP41_007615 [Naegleria fowleri]KAF0983700.1 hypothetical protein FDP41_007615 [Naegleria fowleri]
MTPRIQHPAPSFSKTALLPDGSFGTINLNDYKGKYVVLFFYPLDFTFSLVSQWTVNSLYLAWTQTPRNQGGLGSLNIPLISDLDQSLSATYGVLMEDGTAVRGTFLIDDQQVLRQITVNDMDVGRNVDEILRLVQAFQFVAQHGEKEKSTNKKSKKKLKNRILLPFDPQQDNMISDEEFRRLIGVGTSSKPSSASTTTSTTVSFPKTSTLPPTQHSSKSQTQDSLLTALLNEEEPAEIPRDDIKNPFVVRSTTTPHNSSKKNEEDVLDLTQIDTSMLREAFDDLTQIDQEDEVLISSPPISTPKKNLNRSAVLPPTPPQFVTPSVVKQAIDNINSLKSDNLKLFVESSSIREEKAAAATEEEGKVKMRIKKRDTTTDDEEDENYTKDTSTPKKRKSPTKSKSTTPKKKKVGGWVMDLDEEKEWDEKSKKAIEEMRKRFESVDKVKLKTSSPLADQEEIHLTELVQ